MRADEILLARPELAQDPVARELCTIMTCPTGKTSAGYPYLRPAAWRRLRDWVPLLFDAGVQTLNASARVRAAAVELGLGDDVIATVERAASVIAQVVKTSAICAPADLWVLRHVVAQLHVAGLADALSSGVLRADAVADVVATELRIDLRFLLSRGVLVRAEGGGHRLAPHTHAASIFALPPPPSSSSSSMSLSWAAAAAGSLDDAGLKALLSSIEALPDDARESGLWTPTAREVVIGARLVPVVLGLAAAGRTAALSSQTTPLLPSDLVPHHQDLGAAALQVLRDAAVVDDDGVVTVLGKRVLSKGPGPFGIIETYRGYLDHLPAIWRSGRGAVHVERGGNVAASQAANAKSFGEANDALDAFCAETGFSYRVFIEHALGRGEATRQRLERSGQELAYFGADLEDAAIAAAKAEHAHGHLPANMVFIDNADIANAARVIDVVRAEGKDTNGAVMVFGNGFHEVREQTDERITAVFRAYADAGIVLLFTEESALAIDDLIETAWNTYHACFRYVHERSGQHLRPAEARAPSTLEDQLATSWAECATRGGYVRLERYCRRGRTIHPYPPASGQNPAVSVTHFMVPAGLAARLDR